MSAGSDDRRATGVSPEIERELLAMIAQGYLLPTIKRLHEATGLPFAECKRWVSDRIPRPPLPPCPYCGKPLRTDRARQCFECGADWHAAAADARAVLPE